MFDVENGAVKARLHGQAGRTFAAYACFGLLIFSIVLFISLSIKHVTVQMGNRTMSFLTFNPTVGDLIREIGIQGNIGCEKDAGALGEGESVSYYTLSRDPDTQLTDGMNIRVYRDSIEKTVENIVLPASTVREWDIFMEPGREKLISPGKAGLMKNTIVTYYRDGQVVSRQKTGSRQVSSPSPGVIACGSYDAVSRQGNMRIGKPMKFVATAYTYTGYRTAAGAKTRRGIVAVDPKVIPMGTHMFIEGYGYAVAADTGGFIKGRRIDVFMESYPETVKWGRRTVNVYIPGKK